MPKLHDLARLIRSKNAGPFHQTLDIMFETKENYLLVRDKNVITPRLISELYGLSEDAVTVYNYDMANAIKVVFPRPVGAGDIGNTDVYGAQQHAPLLGIDI